MTYNVFLLKWNQRFASNDTFNISAADLRDYSQDLVDTFGLTLPNVPTYVAGTTYLAGYLVRYSQAGGRESFYYAQLAGQLPHPTYNQSDANWKVVPGPVSELALSQYITLFEAQGLENDSVVRGRRYGVHGLWNGSATEELVEVDGLENTFRQRGTLVRADGTQLEVEVNILAGTYVAAAGGGVTAADLATVATTLPVSRRLLNTSSTANPTRSLTLASSDAGCVIIITSNVDVTVYVPANTTAPLPALALFFVRRRGTGNVTLAREAGPAGASVQLVSADGLRVPASGEATLHHEDVDTYFISGGIS